MGIMMYTHTIHHSPSCIILHTPYTIHHTGGLHSIPNTAVPGALLLGCSAGFLNSVKIKGMGYTHTHTHICT
ncbi:hypothetical protein EON63_05180 [archaeon]|nr:MAG: hypothetical protein EON63_05180 [archaeon]